MDDLEETIEASLCGIQVERGPERKRTERAYTPFVGLTLATDYSRRWKQTGECLGNPKWPEGKTTKEMQQFRQEATKYLISDAVLHHRRKTNELPGQVIGSTELKRKAMKDQHALSGHRGRD